jgi:hypothetical protein
VPKVISLFLHESDEPYNFFIIAEAHESKGSVVF